MEPANIRLKQLPSFLKWAISAYLLLASIGFVFAGLMSHDRYQLDHKKTIQYYLGDPSEGEVPFPKPYSHLVQVTHVHSFMLPVVFGLLWGILHFVSIRSSVKKLLLLGGVASILIYNAAPYLVRFVSSHTVILFTVGGVGLFAFFLIPALLTFFDLWIGFKKNPLS